MVALTAYGFGSVANALNIGGNSLVNFIPSDITSLNDQQLTQMNDSSFQPVYLIQHAITTSNLTSNTTSNSTNDTNSDNQTDNQDNSQNYNQ